MGPLICLLDPRTCLSSQRPSPAPCTVPAVIGAPPTTPEAPHRDWPSGPQARRGPGGPAGCHAQVAAACPLDCAAYSRPSLQLMPTHLAWPRVLGAPTCPVSVQALCCQTPAPTQQPGGRADRAEGRGHRATPAPVPSAKACPAPPSPPACPARRPAHSPVHSPPLPSAPWAVCPHLQSALWCLMADWGPCWLSLSCSVLPVTVVETDSPAHPAQDGEAPREIEAV